jgi:hypothetical protein
VTLARHVSPGDEVITEVARLLVRLVKLTPLGFAKLRDADPDEALALLAEGDEHLGPHLAAANERRRDGRASLGGYDDIEPIDIEAALAQSMEDDEPT